MAYNFTVKIINYLPRLFSRLESRVKKKTGVAGQVRSARFSSDVGAELRESAVGQVWACRSFWAVRWARHPGTL